MSSDYKRRYISIWIYHSVYYSFTFNMASTLYQAYAIRVLGYDVNELGDAVFLSLAAIALGNILAVRMVYRYRDRRVLIWKIFTTVNIVSWALTGFSDLIHKYSLALFLFLAQLAGAIGGLAYSDTIVDLIPKDKSLAVFSRVSIYTVTAALISLVISFTSFLTFGFTVTSYRLCFSLALISSIASSILLWFMIDPNTRPRQNISFRGVLQLYKAIALDSRCRGFIASVSIYIFFVNLPAAIWNYYIIRVFNGDEVWISLNTIANTFTNALGNYIITLISHRARPRVVYSYSALAIAFVPFVFLASPTLDRQIALNLFSGFGWAGFNLATNLYNLYLAGENRVYLVSLNAILINLSASIASRIGSAIAAIGLEAMNAVFIASGLGRIVSYLYMRKTLPNL